MFQYSFHAVCPIVLPLVLQSYLVVLNLVSILISCTELNENNYSGAIKHFKFSGILLLKIDTVARETLNCMGDIS